MVVRRVGLLCYRRLECWVVWGLGSESWKWRKRHLREIRVMICRIRRRRVLSCSELSWVGYKWRDGGNLGVGIVEDVRLRGGCL